MNQIITTFIFILLVISCSKTDNSFSQDDLLGCWNHDMENQNIEAGEGYLLAKCDSREFQNTFYRYNLVFEEDGKGSELLLAQNDAHSSAPITWALRLDELTVNGTFGQVKYTVENMADETIFLLKK